MKIFALWCHPRSVSTAFERVMRERGDLDVLHEPFMYDYYLNRAPRRFPDFRPDPDHPANYADTRRMILRRAEGGPVFFKDMAYYVLDTLPDDAEFRDAITHAFLVRHPAESILSYARKDPGFASVELGIEAEWRMSGCGTGPKRCPGTGRCRQTGRRCRSGMARFWPQGKSARPSGRATRWRRSRHLARLTRTTWIIT